MRSHLSILSATTSVCAENFYSRDLQVLADEFWYVNPNFIEPNQMGGRNPIGEVAQFHHSYIHSLNHLHHLRRKKQSRPMRVRTVREHKINMEIRYDEVRVIEIAGESTNEVMSAKEAMNIAREQEMDLVEITAQASPPVVKVIDYTKFAYDLKKQKKEQRAKQHQTTLKELRFGPNTDDHDFNFKVKHAEKFLQEGNKLKTFVQFRGRNIIYKDRGFDLMGRLADELIEVGKVEMEPKMEGRRMIMIMSPK